jgi:hypothetical protein
MAVHTRPVSCPLAMVTAVRVLATPHWELFPLVENEVGKKYFNSGVCVF